MFLPAWPHISLLSATAKVREERKVAILSFTRPLLYARHCVCDILSPSVSVAPGHEHPWPHCIKEEGVQYGSSLPRGSLPDLAGLNTVCFRELGIWVDEAFREDPVTLRRLEKARVTVKGKGALGPQGCRGPNETCFAPSFTVSRHCSPQRPPAI